MPRRPSDFGGFVGQTSVVNHLRIIVNGAKKRGQPFPHLLLMAQSGFGKTRLARALVEGFGSNFHQFVASPELKIVNLRESLLSFDHGDVAFIDEVHELSPVCQDYLLRPLDEWKISTHDRDRPTSSLAQFSLIAATNRPGTLRVAFRKRLIQVEFGPYTDDELREVARRGALDLGMEVTPQGLRALANAAQGSPRGVLQRLTILRLFLPTAHQFSQTDVEDSLASEGIDAYGLTPLQRQILYILDESPGGKCSLTHLAARLGTDIANVRETLEPFLIQCGWIDPHQAGGRTITIRGRMVVEALRSGASKTQYPMQLRKKGSR